LSAASFDDLYILSPCGFLVNTFFQIFFRFYFVLQAAVFVTTKISIPRISGLESAFNRINPLCPSNAQLSSVFLIYPQADTPG